MFDAIFDGGKFRDFEMSDIEQMLISEILEEHGIESCLVTNRKRRKSGTDGFLDAVVTMDRYIRLKAGGYTIIVSLARIDYDDISTLTEEIESEIFFWKNCEPLEKLWYNDGMKYVRCLSADHNNRTLVFE